MISDRKVLIIKYVPILDLIAGIQDAAKIVPRVNTSNIFCHDSCNIIKKAKHKAQINTSKKNCKDIRKWLKKNDLCLLEAEKSRATCITNKCQIQKW